MHISTVIIYDNRYLPEQKLVVTKTWTGYSFDSNYEEHREYSVNGKTVSYSQFAAELAEYDGLEYNTTNGDFEYTKKLPTVRELINQLQ